MKIDNIGDYLKSNEIKPSYHRIKIFKYLIEKKNHPTVDMIYKELQGELPTLSKTTVYNTLKLFLEKKLVMVVTIEENEARYDADTSIHGHLKCEKCGKVYDFEIDMDKLEVSNLEEFQINEKQVYFKGICKECLEK